MKRAVSPAPLKNKSSSTSPQPLTAESDLFKPATVPARYPGVTDKIWLVLFLSSFVCVIAIRNVYAPVYSSGRWISYDDLFKFAFDIGKQDAPAVLLPLLGACLLTMILLNVIAVFSKPIVLLSFFATPLIFIWSLIQWSKATTFFSNHNENRIILISSLLLLSLVTRLYLLRRSKLHYASDAIKDGCYILGKPSTLASYLLLNTIMLSLWGLWGKYVVKTMMSIDSGVNNHINSECYHKGHCGFSPGDFWNGASSFAGIFCSLQLMVYTGTHFALWNMIVGRHTATQFFNIPSGFFFCVFDTIAHGTGTAAVIGGVYAILSTIYNTVDRIIRSVEPPGCWFVALPVTWPFYIVKWFVAILIAFFNYLVPLIAGITCQPMSDAIATTKEHLGIPIVAIGNTMWWICKMISLCSFPLMLWIVTKTSTYFHPDPSWKDWFEHEFATFVIALILCMVLLETTMSSLLDVAMASAFCGSIRDKARGKVSADGITDSANSIGQSKFASAPIYLFGIALFLILSHMANLPYLTYVDDFLERLFRAL